MSKSLFDYVKENPCDDPLEQAPVLPVENPEELKNAIGEMINRGEPPETILHNALDLIALLMNDKEWAEALQENIAKGYAVRYETEAAAIAAKKQEFQEKLMKQLQKQANTCNSIEFELQRIMERLQELTDDGLMAIPY